MIYRVSTLGIIGRIAISLIVVVVIQGILAYRFRVFNFFDLPLVFSIYYGFTLGHPIAAIVIGSALGLMQDSLSGAAMGTNGFSKTLLGFLAASAVSKFNVDQPIARIFALFLFTIADGLVVTILGLMVGPPNLIYGGSAPSLLLSATLNTLFGLVLFGYHDRFGNAAT